MRARSLDRKWVLRACSRALFEDVATRYQAGVENFEFPGGQAWEPQVELGRFAAQNFRGHVRVSTQRKTSTVPSLYEDIVVRPGSFFYLYRLAYFRNFCMVVRILEKIWERAVSWLPGADPMRDLGQTFQTLKTSETPNFSFRPFEQFANSSFYLGPVSEMQLSKGAIDDFEKHHTIRKYVAQAAVGLLGPEGLAVLYFVSFVDKVHTIVFINYGKAHFKYLFKGMLDLEEQ